MLGLSLTQLKSSLNETYLKKACHYSLNEVPSLKDISPIFDRWENDAHSQSQRVCAEYRQN